MKYGLPTDDGTTVGKVFGRAARFAVYDDETRVTSLRENTGADSEHGAGTGAAALLAEIGVRVVIAPEVGPKAESGLKSAGIEIKAAVAGTPFADALRQAGVRVIAREGGTE